MTLPYPPDPDTSVATLANGVRVVAIRLPHLATASVSVFVRSGSQHESRRENGISHVVEHMAFKGTHERDCQRINLDAERLGAEVNAHTDKDHTAYHMVGLARHAGDFLQMLGDIVLNGSFPEDELERERQVILHEYTEDEDDALSNAYRLFDRNCYGEHPVAQPVIGTRHNIQQFRRADLLDYVQRQYTATNVVVGVAGAIDPERVVREAERSFGAMRRGADNLVPPPSYHGGLRTRPLTGYAQTHIVFGFPIPALAEDHLPSVVAATLLGEGMSSPLMDQLRERRGLVYYAACSADVAPLCGQFVIEASTAPEHVDEFFAEATRLLALHAEQIDAVALERARNQLLVRSLRAQERPGQRLEAAAQDLYVHGRLRSSAEWLAGIEGVGEARVREAFAHMLSARASIAVAGKVGRGTADRAQRVFDGRWPH